MTTQLFGIKNSDDMLKALVAQYQDFLLDDLSTIKAINLSSVAWHMIDRVFNEFFYTGPKGSERTREENRTYDRELSQFRETLYPRCPSLLGIGAS